MCECECKVDGKFIVSTATPDSLMAFDTRTKLPGVALPTNGSNKKVMPFGPSPIGRGHARKEAERMRIVKDRINTKIKGHIRKRCRHDCCAGDAAYLSGSVSAPTDLVRCSASVNESSGVTESRPKSAGRALGHQVQSLH